MQYKIIKSSDPQVVVDKVNDELVKGWKPCGGIAVSSVYLDGPVAAPSAEYAQALIKD